MPEFLFSSSPSIVWAGYLVPCMANALTALVAWQGLRRLHQDPLRETGLAFALAAAIQATLLFAAGAPGQPVPSPLTRALDAVSALVVIWAFLERGRREFLAGALSACAVLGAFTLSVWRILRVEPAWIASLWSCAQAILWSIGLFALVRQGRERLLMGAFGLLATGEMANAAGVAPWALFTRLIAFPTMTMALMQIVTRDLEGAQTELLTFSEFSLRQTQQLVALLRSSTALLVHSEVGAILREAAEGVALGVDADRVLVGLLDQNPQQVFNIYALYPRRPLPQPTRVPLQSQPALLSAVQNTQTQSVVLTASQRGIHALAELMAGAPGPAVLQPMISHGRLLGLIVALNDHSRRAFTDRELQVLEAFGSQVAAVAENALLVRMIEQQTRDLSELLAARDAEASRRAAILESIADGVIVFDNAERVVVTNPAARVILGLQESSVYRVTLHDLLQREARQDQYAFVHLMIESGQPLPPGYKLPLNGKTVALSVAPVMLRSTDRHGTVMVLHDMTQDAEVDRVKSEFVSVVSHELRTPFASLDFSLQLLHKYGVENWKPEQREQLGQLREGLKQARTMVNNLVTFAAFLSKQGQLRMTPLDLGQVVREAAQELETIARGRNIAVTYDLAGSLPCVYGDREKLGEAVYHLMHNAIKFSQQGGAVKLRCRAASNDVVVEVSDTGTGIPPDKLQEIWKDFSQLADPLRRGVEGLGLGLPLVRYVVKAHGGQVWARSRPGEGSTFGFYIPAAAGQSLSLRGSSQ